ncbi:MAG: hypothetical protein P1V97_16935 [Planctomycetota bacterium]|nr:hypothetical protein [Planctomycetota bacterium]
MNCPSPLLFFQAKPVLSPEERASLGRHVAQCGQCGPLHQNAKRLTKRLHKSHQPVLSRCEDSMTLARFLQGKDGADERSRFTLHLIDCDSCLGELAFSLKQYKAPAIRSPLKKKLQALFHQRQSRDGALGRSEDIYGEASTSGDQPGLRQIQKDLLPDAVPDGKKGRRPATGRMGRRSGSNRQSMQRDVDSDEETPPVKSGSTSGSFPLDSAAFVPAEKAKVGLGRSFLFAFIGAGVVLVFAVIPLVKISKDLFSRARKSEIRIAKAIKVHEKKNQEFNDASDRITDLEGQLRKRPTIDVVNRYENTARIWKSQFKRAEERRKKEAKRHKDAIKKLDARYNLALRGLENQLRKEQTERFPDRFFQTIAGRGYPKVPDNEKLIELVKTSNNKLGVAAFFALEQRGLGTLAIALSNKRSKLSLMNFFARPYLATLSNEDKHWDLLGTILHKDLVVRTEGLTVLKSMRIETHGYKFDLSNKELNDVVATMAADWNRRYNKSKGPKPLPYRDEGS